MNQNLSTFHLCQVPVLQEMGAQLIPTPVEGQQAHSVEGTVSLSHSFECSGFLWRDYEIYKR